MGAAMSCCCRDLLVWDQLRRAEGEAYLSLMETIVSQLKDKYFVLKSRSGPGFKLRIAGIDDTMYRESTEEVDDWGMFYLPDVVVKMCVFAVVEGTSCPCGELVLMTCEDKKVYGYDGEDLHEVASDLKELRDEGLKYPASKKYPMETFKDIVISRELTKEEKKLKEEKAFKYNAVMIIRHMLYWSKYTPEGKNLVDEILHSIFFLGQISTPKIEPKDIVDEEMLNMLKGQYPRPLEYCRTRVPRRSPFSCVLDMIVLKVKESQVDKIKKRLRQLAGRLQSGFLVSIAMCITTYNDCNYYGVSMSATGRNVAKIMIAASCLSSWDECVAGAVMTYYFKKPGEGVKESDFDGTIKLPDQVTCTAFNIKGGNEMTPCMHCRDLFGLSTVETTCPAWKHGNCAEVESVSNCLKPAENHHVKEEVKQASPEYTSEDRKKVEDRLLEDLTKLLLQKNFHLQFYTP